MKDPLFIAYQEKVEAMVPGGNNLCHIDRLAKIDAANRAETTEDKRRCLRNIIHNRRWRILPNFCRKNSCKNGVRYSGDGGPDPQVQTNHESCEDSEDSGVENHEEHSALQKKPNRPRDTEKRRVVARKWAQKEARINLN